MKTALSDLATSENIATPRKLESLFFFLQSRQQSVTCIVVFPRTKENRHSSRKSFIWVFVITHFAEASISRRLTSRTSVGETVSDDRRVND